MIPLTVYCRGARRRAAMRAWARGQPPGEVCVALIPPWQDDGREPSCAGAGSSALAVVDLGDGTAAAADSIAAARAAGAEQIAGWSGAGVSLDGEIAALRAGARELVDLEGSVDRRLPSLADWLGRYARTRRGPVPAPGLEPGRRAQPQAPVPLVLIAASTGGPQALAAVLAALPGQLPAAILIAQHMERAHLPNTRSWLAGKTPLPIVLAEQPVFLRPSTVYLARGGDHLVVRVGGMLAYTDEPRSAPFRPSGDVLFESGARQTRAPVLGVVLSGLGADGARGLLALRRAGCRTIAQDEASSRVYGMPKAAREAGGAERVLGLSEIAREIVAWARAPKPPPHLFPPPRPEQRPWVTTRLPPISRPCTPQRERARRKR